MCGEQAIEAIFAGTAAGSPPRVRGTELRPTWVVGENGITPACAGNSVAEAFIPNPLKDHPRVCGEQAPPTSFRQPPPGSPPRVRGTASLRTCCTEKHRITPACAGNRDPPGMPAAQYGDHPRVCGEQTYRCGYETLPLGSPPRVRGTVNNGGLMDKLKGITPACAGNSTSWSEGAMFEKDHPRVCGEQSFTGCCNHSRTGSPPRVRGTVKKADLVVLDDRITPACAGNRKKILL